MMGAVVGLELQRGRLVPGTAGGHRQLAQTAIGAYSAGKPDPPKNQFSTA